MLFYIRYRHIYTHKRLKIVIACIWIVPISSFILPIIFEPGHEYYLYSPAVYSCNCQIRHLWFFLLTGPYMPILSSCTMSFTTFHIIRKLKEVRQLGETIRQNKSRTEKNAKAVKFILISTTFFTIAYCPFIALTFIDFISNRTIKRPPIVDFICTWTANANSFINIVIYACVYSSFRENSKRILLKCCKCEIIREKYFKKPVYIPNIKNLETMCDNSSSEQILDTDIKENFPSENKY